MIVLSLTAEDGGTPYGIYVVNCHIDQAQEVELAAMNAVQQLMEGENEEWDADDVLKILRSKGWEILDTTHIRVCAY